MNSFFSLLVLVFLSSISHFHSFSISSSTSSSLKYSSSNRFVNSNGNVNVNNVAMETVRSGARSMTMMPIGVPKVAYRMPGSRGGEWVDIYNRLTRERSVRTSTSISLTY